MQETQTILSDRVKGIDVSGIRRVFELGAQLTNPINLSIGQPDFPVPDPLKQAAIEAIRDDRNGYTLTQGAPELLHAASSHLATDVGWSCTEGIGGETSLMISSGTSGALLLAFLAIMNPGDEVIAADPYFVAYPAMAAISGARLVCCDTYPDFRMTAARVEPLISDRTKIILLNSPGNPSGVVLSDQELQDLVDLCARRNVLLVADEIYDLFTYPDVRENGRCPSAARHTGDMLLIRGFGKSYGCTGWRMGYVAGPTEIIREMAKLQQYTFVCAPSMAQQAMVHAFGVDMSAQIELYQNRRDLVVEMLGAVTEVTKPGGAFYAFARVPEHLGLTATEFVERAIEERVLIIPGSVFSRRDTHFRLSYAAPDDQLREGLDILAKLMN